MYFTDDDGNIKSSAKESERLRIMVGTTVDDIDFCTLYVAQYDKNDVLLAADWSAAKESLSITVADDAAYIKAFLWDDMSPASAAANLTIEE